MNDSYQSNCVTAEIDQSHQIQSGNHSCNDCEAIFTNITNLEKHKQLHNENSEFICLLCKEVFDDFQKLKLHDLRHSLEEANENIIDIDKLVSPLGFSCCECSKSFSCDQELIDHCVLTHIKSSEGVEPANCEEVLPAAESNESLESCDSDEDHTNYPLLREEVIHTRNGDQYIRFTLIDHQNCHVEEFTHLLHRKNKMKFISPQRSKKSHISTTSKKKFKPSQSTIKRKTSKSNLKQSKANFVNGIAKNIKNKKEPRKNMVLSSDSELDVSVEPSDPSAPRQRRSKLLALKKKIWRDNSGNSLLPKINKGTIKSNAPKANKVSFDKKYSGDTEDDVKSYTCYVCEQVIVSKVEFLNHLKKHSQNGIISCSKCQRNFTSVRNIMSHRCGSKACVSCKLCNYEFPRVSNFKRHLLRVHRMKEDEAALIIESTPKSSICHVCKNAFSSFACLKRHIVKVHKVSQEKAESLIASFPRVKLSDEQEVVGEENGTQLVDNSVIETQGCPSISSEANSEESAVNDASSEIQQNGVSFYSESKTQDISIRTKRHTDKKRLTSTKKQASSNVKKVIHLKKPRSSNLEEVINRNKQSSLNVKKVTGPNKLKVKKIVSSVKQKPLNSKKINNRKSLIMNKIHNLNKSKSLITQRVNSPNKQTPLHKKKLPGYKKNIIDSKKKIANSNKLNNSSVQRKSSRSNVVSIVAVIEKSTPNIKSTKKSKTKMNGIPAINSSRGNLNKKSTLSNVKQVFKKMTHPISPSSKNPKNKSVNNKASLKKNIKTKNVKCVVKSLRKSSVSPKTKTQAKKSIVKSVRKSVAKKSSLKKNGKVLRTTPKDIKRSKK